MKKIIRLTESDLARIIKRVISEQETDPMNDCVKTHFPEVTNFKIPSSCTKLMSDPTNPMYLMTCGIEVSSQLSGINPMEIPGKVMAFTSCLSEKK